MRKYYIILLVLLLFIYACDRQDKQDMINAYSVQLLPQTLSMVVGQREQLSVVVRPDGIAYEEIQWSSTCSNVAMVSEDGIVDALHEGESVVTASNGSEKGICHIKVMPTSAVINSLSLDQTELKLSVGETCTLSVTIEPIGASAFDVEWTSSDASRASVQGGVVKALAPGITIITAAVGSNKADCQVCVFDDNAYEFVDLGLSVLWGSCNIGADYPEDYGCFFGWGEKEEKDYYEWDTYKWRDGSSDRLTKYNRIDGMVELTRFDDVAYVVLGDGVRIPTKEEWAELCDNCSWQDLYGLGVCQLKSKINGRSIILPYSGAQYGSRSNKRNSYGSYWSSTLDFNNPRNAWIISFDSWGAAEAELSRCYGLPIRPVKNKTAYHEAVDLGLSVLWGAYNIGAEQESDYGGYYAWGELNTKMWYHWDSYQLGSWNNEIINMDYYNSIDNLRKLKLEDDIAHQLWGGKWRMPTAAEYNELLKKCNYTWMELNNVKGIMMTSKVNGNSIFFPAGGGIDVYDEYERGSMIWCWASTKSSGDDRNADGLEYWNGSISVSHYLPRYLGFPVRAVKDY